MISIGALLNMKNFTLKTKLLIGFLFTGLMPVFGIGLYLYLQSSDALKHEAIVKLESIKNLKSNAIQNYFKLIQNQVLTLAHNEGVKDSFEGFNIGFINYMSDQKVSSVDLIAQKQKLNGYYVNDFAKEYVKQNSKEVNVAPLLNLPDEGLALQYAYIANNPNPLGSKHLLDVPNKVGTYNLTHATHHANFREFLERFEFYDIFLIDAQTGNIIYTVFKELDFATSIKDGPYKDSGLAKVFHKAMAINNETEVVMEDYETYVPSYSGPAGFLAAPVWINGVKKGVIAFQISFDKINSITLEKTGNEKSLETFLVGSDFKMRSDSVMDKENRNVRSSFRNPEKGSSKSPLISRALGGENVQEVSDNFLGIPAVIAAGPINVFGYKWAIETQIYEEEAFASIKSMRVAFLILMLITAFIVSALAAWFARNLANSLLNVTEGLRNEAVTVGHTSQEVADLSNKLSEATTEQAASLQETVASIDEISAMISRNADSAASSARLSELSTLAAHKGKDKVEQMMESINSISSGNEEIIDQMHKSNREISEIVKVIQEISQKTQVINDIVFQTKLLSFNASVEAARAGEHGKGFAVVAEEVGNLASMSGKAATEITDMLSKSVKRVTDIVDGTKDLMENLIGKSKVKIQFSTTTAKECAQALDEISRNVSSVNEAVQEISVASQEQSTGVKEVNKAMSELDQVTQVNSSSAQASSHTAGELKSQAERLNDLVQRLSKLVNGEGYQAEQKYKNDGSGDGGDKDNLVENRSSAKNDKMKTAARKVKINPDAPSATDSRFEDV